MAKRKSRAKPERHWNLATIFRPETIGTVLVVLGVLTLLTLLTPNRSATTGELIAGLRWAFGVGAWLVPILSGSIGLWLILREMVDQQWLSGRRILGEFVVFLASEGLLHLLLSGAQWNNWATDQFRGEGGVAGWLIGQLLVPILDVPATIGALVMTAAAGLFVVSGLTLGQIKGGFLAVGRRRCTATHPEPETFL